MPQWSDGLEGVYLEIAELPSSPLHVLAGPGTGKTFAMMRRVARLLEEGASPDTVLALSFTRTAARDLREQLSSLGVQHAGSVRAATLHSLCFSILSQAAVFAHTQRTARPLLSYEVKYLEIDLAGIFGGIKNVRLLLAAYEAAWARLQTEDPGGPRGDLDADFHAAIVAWLRYHRAVLIGELVPLTLAFTQQNPAIPVLPSLDHVLVDEYQDLNRAEQELIGRMAANGTITVVGDDNQSIYSFRHANPEGIRTFAADNPGTISKTIEQCRRCPPNIVAMSNSLISNEPNRSRAVPLVPDSSKPPANVVIVQHRTLDDETQTCADFVREYIRQHEGMPAGQVLALAPRRFMGNALRDALIARGLNAMSYFAEDPVQKPSAAEGFCLLALLVDKSDRAALRAWLGMGSTNGRSAGYERMRRIAEANREDPATTLERAERGDVAIPHGASIITRWRELNDRRTALEGLKGLELVRAIWSPDDDESDEVRLMAEEIAVASQEPKAILESLREQVTQPYLPGSKSDVIRVMSLHKSKGLTASLVVILGSVAGALPHVERQSDHAAQAAQLAEQRRLFYVAMTRATDTLIISGFSMVPFAQAMQGGVTVVRQRRIDGVAYAMTAMSPFVGELGASAPNVQTGSNWRRTWET